MEIEVMAYAAAAARGDVLPAFIRLTAARAAADWTLRTQLVLGCGPVAPQAALDRACSFMPDAPEPRLLRAARSMHLAEETCCTASRRAWLALAERDLAEASRLDPMDSTARGLLATLVGSSAWGIPCARAA